MKGFEDGTSLGSHDPWRGVTMNVQNLDGAFVRDLVASCDLSDALKIPKALFLYITSVLDAREPNVYLIDLIPSLSAAAQGFLTAVGAFNRTPLPEPEVASRRGRLLECLDAFIDEARLSQQTTAFMQALRTMDRS